MSEVVNPTTPAPDNTQAVPTDAPKPVESATQTAPKPADPTPEVPTKTPAEAAPVVPEKYDLKLSEGSLLDPSVLGKIETYAKELKLTQEQATAVLAEREEAVASFVEERKATWMKETQADKEIGGEGLKNNLELSSRVLERFGSPELKAELDRSGYGNSPAVIRLLTRIGKAMSDDQLVSKGTQGAGRPPIEERLYPNHKEK
jgi:hypothetical protein